jgi:hypothetical protein
MVATASPHVVDFSNVKDGGNFNKNRVPSGDYLAKVIKVEDSKTKDGDEFMYLFTIQLVKYSQSKLPYYCKLTENQLWKLRNLLIAAGMTVPKKRMKLDPNKVVGKSIGVTIEDAEYEGKAQSEVASIFPAAELMDGAESAIDDDEPEEEEVDAIDDVEDDVEEEEEEAPADEFDDMDRTAIKAYITGINADFKAKKSQTDDDLREVARALGDADEEEEEEEAPAPKPKAKAKAKPAAKKKKAADITDDELEELDIDDL